MCSTCWVSAAKFYIIYIPAFPVVLKHQLGWGKGSSKSKGISRAEVDADFTWNGSCFPAHQGQLPRGFVSSWGDPKLFPPELGHSRARGNVRAGAILVKEVLRQLRSMYLPVAVFPDGETQVFWCLRFSPGEKKINLTNFAPTLQHWLLPFSNLAAAAPGHHGLRSLEQPNSVLIKVIFKLEKPHIRADFFWLFFFFLFGKPAREPCFPTCGLGFGVPKIKMRGFVRGKSRIP